MKYKKGINKIIAQQKSTEHSPKLEDKNWLGMQKYLVEAKSQDYSPRRLQQ